MKKIYFLFLIIWPVIVFAGDTGNAGFQFLQMDAGAKPAAMAGAFVAASEDLNGLSYNPASIANLKRREMLFTAADDLMDFKTGYLTYTQPWQERQIGIVCQYRDYGEIQETDIIGESLGKISANDIALTAGIAQTLSSRLKAGIALKLIQSNLAGYSAAAVGMDFGVLYSIPNQELHIGLAVNNAGFSVKAYDETHEKMPLNYQLGFSKKLAHLPLKIHGNVNRFHHDASDLSGGFYWKAGGEFTLSRHLFLRLGYHSRGSEQKLGSTQNRGAGLSFGMGLAMKPYRLDFASVSHGIAGRVNQFTIAMQF